VSEEPSGVFFMGEPPIIPYAKLPPAMELPPRMTLPIPSAPIPSYQPLVLPSASQIRKARAEQNEAQKREEQEKKVAPQRPAPVPQVQIPAVKVDTPTQQEEVTEINVPVLNVSVPVPSAEIVTTAAITAGTAALASVGATMAAGPMFQRIVKILKPAMKTALKKIAVVRKMRPVESEAKLRWRQHARTRYSARYRA
jgi:hypothetical protein